MAVKLGGAWIVIVLGWNYVVAPLNKIYNGLGWGAIIALAIVGLFVYARLTGRDSPLDVIREGLGS
jgi:hypothetical protein